MADRKLFGNLGARQRMATKETVLPIEREGWDQMDTAAFMFSGVKFLADFGCFRQGEQLDFLQVDYENGKVYTSDAEGQDDRVVKVKLVPA